MLSCGSTVGLVSREERFIKSNYSNVLKRIKGKQYWSVCKNILFESKGLASCSRRDQNCFKELILKHPSEQFGRLGALGVKTKWGTIKFLWYIWHIIIIRVLRLTKFSEFGEEEVSINCWLLVLCISSERQSCSRSIFSSVSWFKGNSNNCAER